MFLEPQSHKFQPLGKRILLQLAFRQKYNPNLITPDGVNINDSLITKEVFNVCKILAISPQSDLFLHLKEGDFVCLQDEWLEEEPDFQRVFSFDKENLNLLDHLENYCLISFLLIK